LAIQAIQAVRGMNDILPADVWRWQLIESRAREVLGAYGYREIRFPIVEKTELFKRSIGEVTDIVEKEMYSFDDRNGDSLTLRPEGTAGCVRAAIQQGIINDGVQRLWYSGPMFRHERPQKGRYRQFHQLGVEVFGLPGPDIDAELILISARLWQALGITDVSLQLNSLGSSESRARYREALVAYLKKHHEHLDDDSRRRLSTNPLRVLDSKHPAVQAVVADAPGLAAYLDEASQQHFEGLCARLDAAQIAYTVNRRLVRGLDYYSDTVFEWVTDSLGAQGTICAGGRYDRLVNWLGGKSCPAVGFAMGMERLAELLAPDRELVQNPQVYCVALGEAAQIAMMKLAEDLRDQLPRLSLVVHCGGGSGKSQFKKADRSGARLALIIGDDELAQQRVTVKPLRDSGGTQETVSYTALPAMLSQALSLAD